MTGTPSSATRRATVDLPVPMPPVRPMSVRPPRMGPMLHHGLPHGRPARGHRDNATLGALSSPSKSKDAAKAAPGNKPAPAPIVTRADFLAEARDLRSLPPPGP